MNLHDAMVRKVDLEGAIDRGGLEADRIGRGNAAVGEEGEGQL